MFCFVFHYLAKLEETFMFGGVRQWDGRSPCFSLQAENVDVF